MVAVPPETAERYCAADDAGQNRKARKENDKVFDSATGGSSEW